MVAATDEEKWLDALYGPAGGAEPTACAPAPAIRKLPYVVEPGTVVLSYSKLNTLYECPRKFQLAELLGLRAFLPSAHTAFGHSFGAGVQEYLVARCKGHDLELARGIAICAAVAAWDMPDLWAQDKRGIKSIERALLAIDRFIEMYADRILDDYTVAIVGDKYAVELLCYLRINERYNYQGHIDLVLQDRCTEELVVLEIKTGSRAFNSSDWANSPQALGYNCMLQAHGAMSGTQTAYRVLYLFYDAYGMDFTLHPFEKPATVRAEWLTSLLLDVQSIEMYESNALFPKRGNSCNNFNRNCEYFGTCDLTQHHHAAPHEGAYESLPLSAVDVYLDAEALLHHFTGDM